MADPYRTSLDDLDLAPEGWAKLPGTGYEITRLPLIDHGQRLSDGTPLFARIPPAVGAAFAAEHHCELPTMALLEACRRHGLVIEPTTISPHTSTLAGAVDHDTRVRRKLAGAHWDGVRPVCGAGKHPLAGAPPGDVYLGGWWTEHLERYGPGRSGPGWVQQGTSTGRGPHPGQAATLVDYATLTVLVRRTGTPAEADTLSDPGPVPTRLGERGPAVVAWQSWLLGHAYALSRYGADGQHGGETEAATQAWRDDVEFALASVGIPASVVLLEQLCPVIQFRQAEHYGIGRIGGIRGITIHTAECAETPTAAEGLAAYASTMADGRKVSWHYAVDADSITQSVCVEDRAYAAGPGNDAHLHIELAGRAGQCTAGWADAYSVRALELAAALCAKLCVDHDIPVRLCSWRELLAGQDDGLSGHVGWSLASAEARRTGLKTRPWWRANEGTWRITTHPDPGPTFPWESFVARVTAHVMARLQR